MWGDGGPGLGNSTDQDVIYGGQGNDDILGGQGVNTLHAWTRDPKPNGDGQFGVYVGENGQLYDDSGDLDNDGYIDGSSPAQLARRLEDTGINRVLGGPKNDALYGGTGLDFLYGYGSNVPNTPDVLYDRHGNSFDTRATIAGNEWKEYAKSSDKVWYYGGTNRDDVINVDYVTEQGLLQGHHLITRLTSNNGYFTFDAQVRLDFSNWSGDDSFYGLALTGSDVVPGTVPFEENDGRTNGRLTGDAVFNLSVDGGEIKTVTVSASSTADNDNIRDLVEDLRTALANAGLYPEVSAHSNGDRISLIRQSTVTRQQTSLVITYANQVTETSCTSVQNRSPSLDLSVQTVCKA